MKPNEIEKQNKKEKLTELILLLFIILLSLVPIFKGCITDSGESLLWSLRIKRFFSDGMVTSVFLISMGILKILLGLSAYVFFKTFFFGSGLFIHLSGTILFLFSPYQVYIAYDKYDFTDVALWICILWFATFVVLAFSCTRNKRKSKTLIFFMLSILMLVCMLGTYVVSYTSTSTLSFEGRGYVLGELFSSFFYMDNHPGLGITLITTIFIWLYISVFGFLEDKDTIIKKDRISLFFVFIGIIFSMLSLVEFPWDIVTREIPIIGKILARLEEPTIFVGLAGFCFCIPGIRGLEYIKKSKHDFINTILPVVIVFMAVIVGMYIMSEGMYWQYPLDV